MLAEFAFHQPLLFWKNLRTEGNEYAPADTASPSEGPSGEDKRDFEVPGRHGTTCDT